MHTATPPSISPRADVDEATLSRQNVIIIAACCSVGGLLLCYFLYRRIRNWRRSSNPAPLPPVQPLAHHREHTNAMFEEALSRPQTWFHAHSGPDPAGSGSKVALLDRNGSPSISPHPSITFSESGVGQEVKLSTNEHLPLPSPSYRVDRPGSSASTASSGLSYGPPPHHHPQPSTTPEQPSTTPEQPSYAMPRTVAELRLASPRARNRPSSVSSTGTTNSRASRYTLRGVPHGNNQFQVVLPPPLSSLKNASNESVPLPGRLRQSASYDRRSVADPWLAIGYNATNSANASAEDLRPEDVQQSHIRPRAIPMSLGGAHTATSVIDQVTSPPPVPQLPRNADMMSQRDAPHQSTRAPRAAMQKPETVPEEEARNNGPSINKLQKKRTLQST